MTKTRGRPPRHRLNKTVAFDREVLEWLDSQPENRSDTINDLVRDAMTRKASVGNSVSSAENSVAPAVVDRGTVLLLVASLQEMVRAGGDRAATDLLTARLVGLIEALGYAVPDADSATE